jgi:nitrogen fixation protein FixH
VKILIAVISAVVLGVIVVTFVVGSQVYERRVAEGPDADLRHGHAGEGAGPRPLGLRAAFEPASIRPGGAVLDFTLLDRTGVPVDGAAIQVALTRPAGGGGEARAVARGLGAGRYQAPLGFASPGFWDVRLDVRLGADPVGLTQQVRVEAAPAGPCQLAAGPCTAVVDGLSVTLDLGRSLATMKTLPAVVEVRRGVAPLQGATVEVAFAMKDMNMGENRVALAAAGPGRYAGQAVLVRCHSGRRDWVASVTVRAAGAAPASVQFPFQVTE